MTKNKITFKYCGLDVEKNFLQAPKCNCGCGGYMGIVLETDQDVCNFIHNMLDECECNHCGIFALKKNNDVLMGLKLDGEIKCYVGENDSQGTNDKIFADIQKDLELHTYGLLEQINDDTYSIIME
jgi:hypothetical protein